MKNLTYLLVAIIFFSTIGCMKTDEGVPFTGLQLPSHFPAPVHSMADNTVTKEGFELGRKLFYDPILSRDNTISCGSCHVQGSAFTHHGHDVSHGIDDQVGKRNALPVQNLLWQNTFFWDGGVHNIELISLNPIKNPVEMDENFPRALEKLRAHPEYPSLFKQAFGSAEINSERTLKAMTQFMAMLISADSRYDRYKKGTVQFTESEKQGYELFVQKCAGCHKGELFSDFTYRNNGLTSDFSSDKGRYEISLLDDDIGKFKVPSLRNIAKTKPYMHTGSFYTLQDVLDHYSDGVKMSPTLDPLLQTGTKPGIEMTKEEKSKIIDFLNMLTDEGFLKNPMFAEQ